MNFKVNLLTEAALNMKSWAGVEWFGIEEMYIPYPYLEDYLLGYDISDEMGNFQMEVLESFPYLCAYKNREFLCTIELPFINYSGEIITMKNFRLNIKAPV